MAMGLLFIHSANPSFVVKQALGITMGLGIIIVVSIIRSLQEMQKYCIFLM